jgi:hypothetical protein
MVSTSLHKNLNKNKLFKYATKVYLVSKPRPKRVLQPIANPSVIYTKNAKAHKLQVNAET